MVTEVRAFKNRVLPPPTNFFFFLFEWTCVSTWKLRPSSASWADLSILILYLHSWYILYDTLCRHCSAWSGVVLKKKNSTEILQNFGVVLFSVILVVSGFTEIKKTPNVRGHLKSSHIADKQRTFIWEGGGLDPIRCAIDSKKKKKRR